MQLAFTTQGRVRATMATQLESLTYLKILAYSTVKHHFPIIEPGIKDKSNTSAEFSI